ncbi:MAG: ImmA/IrrE family metallo-endopeptidase [Helicobacter sp.]|nr:ImmA/IrrE family metallo-endopeptidase [Helicobacter sp.]
MQIPERYSKIYIKEVADIILREYNKPFPIDVIEIAKSYGLEVLEGNFDRPDVSGMLDMSTGKPRIIVAASDSFVRKRFSIAHEFGHFVLQHQKREGKQRMVSYRDSVSKMGFDIEEIEANFFAANLLMPTDEVMKLYHGGYSSGEMAEYFNVSMSAMLNRIGALTNE